jgi:hypothetical protein
MSRRSKGAAALTAGALSVCAVVILTVTATVMAVLGGSFGCLGGTTALAGPASATAKREIPPPRLALYQAAGRRFDIDWTFVASIGTQECGTGTCAQVYPSGCGGPMQIAIVRESACSPGPGPTIWETYRVDGGGDGRTDPFDLADSIFTAARIMRVVMHAPPAGGSYAAYRQAACNYYGACADSLVSYAEEVMRRAVSYGFPAAGDGAGYVLGESGGGGCTASVGLGAGDLGAIEKAFAPRRLAALPADVGAFAGIRCDARIVPDVVYLARRFGVLVSSCYSPSGHEPTGEHPLGAAIDAGPRDGDWTRTARLARAVGWQPSCAASGVAPDCARPPFRFVGYNGYPNHGDPAHCVPCAGGPHIHLSWLTSASPGESENRARYGYEPASWIEVFAADAGVAEPAPKSRAGNGRAADRRPVRKGRR